MQTNCQRSIILLALLIGAGLLAGVGWWFLGRSDPEAELAAARERWQEHPIREHYRLEMKESLHFAGDPRLPIDCTYLLEVDAGTVRHETQRGYCLPNQQITVNGLFNLIAYELEQGDRLQRADLVAFGCRRFEQVSARYHPQAGYPLRIRSAWGQQRDWLSREFWLFVVQTRRLPECRSSSISRVVTLEPVEPATSDKLEDRTRLCATIL